MTITVTGTLTTPLGASAPFVVIRLTALVSKGDVLEGSVAEYTTDENGLYTFDVEEGQYTLEVNFDDTYIEVVECVVDAATPNPLTITELANYGTPVYPPVIVPGNADFVNLVNDLRTDVDTDVRELRDQISDGDISVAEVKTITTNDRLDAEMSEVQYQTKNDTAQVKDSSLVYKNSVNQEGVYRKLDMSTRDGEAVLQTEIDEQSDGSTRVTVTDKIVTSDSIHQLAATATSEQVIYARNTDVGSATHGESTYLTPKEGYTQNRLRLNGGTGKTINHTGTLTSTLEYPDGVGGVIQQPKVTVDDFRQITSGINTLTSEANLEMGVDAFSSTYANRKTELTVNNRIARNTISNDGLISKDETILDEWYLQDQLGNNVLSVDTDNKTVNVNAKLTIANPDDFKGEAGNVQYLDYQYSTDNATWHDDFATGDKWRRQREVTGTADTPIYGAWSTGYLLVAEDGHDGDTLYIQYQYSDDQINWHDDMVSGDIWRRERTITNGTPSTGWSTPVRIRGYDGASGEIVTIAYQYAVGALDPDPLWHSNFTTGDHFRRERTEIYLTDADYAAGTPDSVTPWNNITQIVPIAGVDYGLKQSTIYLYQRGVTTPAAPTADLTYDFDTQNLHPVSALNGWSQTIPAGNADLYIAVAVATAVSNMSDPIQPSEWNITKWAAAGFNTATITMYQRVPVGDPDPVPPTHDLTFDFATHAFVAGSDLQGWSMTIPAGTDKIWGCIATAYASTDTDVVTSAEWFLTDQQAVGLNQANMTIYQRAATQPPAPSADATYDFTTGALTGLVNGWLNSVPSGTDPLWVGLATAINYDTVDTIAPAEWDISKLAEDGKTVATANLFCISDTVPAVSFTQANQDVVNDTITIVGSNAEGWQGTFPDNSAKGGKVWHITNAQLIFSGATIAYHVATDFSTPVVYSQNGVDGIQGKVGPGSVGVEKATAADVPTDQTQITSDYITVAGLASTDDVPKGAIISYVSSNDGNHPDYFSPVSYICDVPHAVTATWLPFAVEIDGNQIVHGTVAAETLQADTAISNYVYVGGADEVTISGDGSWTGAPTTPSDNRIWVGSSDPALAAIRMTKDGNLFANNVDLTGNINATSGTFTGEIHASTGTFDGRVSVGSSYIQPGTGTTNFLYSGAGDFRVQHDGKLYANDGYFGGTVEADRISGDIVTAKAYVAPTVTNSFTGRVLYKTVRILNSSTKDRVLSIPFGGTAEISTIGGSGDMQYRVYVDGAAGVTALPTKFLSPTSTATISSETWVEDTGIIIPAGVTGNINYYIEILLASGINPAVTMQGTNYNNGFIASLFVTGSDLG